MKQIPKDLRELLEDDAVIKVGVAPQEDAVKLSHDYGVGVASTLDLRFLCVMANHKPEGLGKLSQTHLNYKLDKHWRLACSNWEAKQLEPKQLDYAANDALVAVAIYQKLCRDLQPRHFWQRCPDDDKNLRTTFEAFLDVDFTKGFSLSGVTRSKGLAQGKGKNGLQRKQPYRQMATRSKDFYDNCLLQAPDGELLCTIDRRKASWYLSQNLGTQISEEPFTVRLNFEPAGRAVGDVGRYYQTIKENQCVVCGDRDAYIRKNVVPREYRKHFPMVMKSHTSHDGQGAEDTAQQAHQAEGQGGGGQEGEGRSQAGHEEEPCDLEVSTGLGRLNITIWIGFNWVFYCREENKKFKKLEKEVQKMAASMKLDEDDVDGEEKDEDEEEAEEEHASEEEEESDDESEESDSEESEAETGSESEPEVSYDYP